MFWKNVASLMTGTAAAQAIALASTPLLTRLYSPAQFSTVALLIAVASIASIVCTMRYEIAIVLPKRQESAAAIAGLAFVMTLVFCFLMMAAIGFYWAELYRLFSVAQTGRWIFLIPTLTFLMSAYSILSMWNCRNHRFRQMAYASAAQQGGYVAIGLLTGIFSSIFNGLVLGRSLGQLIGVITMAKGGGLTNLYTEARNALAKRHWRKLAGSLRQFPLYNAPYSFIGTVSRESIILIFTIIGSLSTAGAYALARTILYAPVGIISFSVGSVFYREAASDLHSTDFQTRITAVFFVIAFLAGPLYAFVAFWAPEIFQVMFGERWRESGEFFALVAPVGFMLLLTSWPERVFEVTGKQHLSFALQFAFDSAAVIAVVMAVHEGIEAWVCIVIYAVITTFFHLFYLGIVFKLMRLKFLEFGKLLSLILLATITPWIMQLIDVYILGRDVTAFFAGITLIMLWYIVTSAIFRVSRTQLLFALKGGTQK